jgi:hypothetical protein
MAFEEPADARVAWLSGEDAGLRAEFLGQAIRRRAYEPSDPEPCDISLIPRVVTAQRQRWLADLVVRLVQASIDAALDARGVAVGSADGYSLAWIASQVGRLPRQLIGNVRFDFLPQGDDLKLLEAGWVNLSAVDYAPQAAVALLETVPALAGEFEVMRPAVRMKRRLGELGVRTLAILVKDAHTAYAENDWEMIREVLRPIGSVVLSEREFGDLSCRDRRVRLGDLPIDAVYLRALDGPVAFTGDHARLNRDTLAMLLGADVIFLDHPLLLLAEDKDLSFLVDRDPGLAEVVPRMRSAQGAVGADAEQWVLKLRDRHSGEGVFFEACDVDRYSEDPGAILQERLDANRFPINSLHGHRGSAITDLAVHVSYRYDVPTRKVVTAEVAGYFSRFTREGLRVNLCTGGGIVPVLSEREDRR